MAGGDLPPPPVRTAGQTRPSAPPRLREGQASLRDAVPSRDVQPPRHAGFQGGLISSGAQRTLLDEASDLGLAPAQETASTSLTPVAAEPWKRKKRASADVFEGDAALKELRSRLAAAPSDQAPEPPATPAKSSFLASAGRLMAVVILAAGGALGFLWVTSPQGPHLASSPKSEVALVSLSDDPSQPAQNRGAERPADPSPTSDAPWAEAKLTGNAVDSVAAPSMLPNTGLQSPRAPANRISAPPPAVQPVPPPAPVVTAPQPSPAAPSLDRDQINAMLERARSLLSSGDVAAARLVLRRAAASDDAQAALALGSTYDPAMLKKLGIISFHADPAQAREWYRKAATLGSSDAELRLEQMVQTDQ